MHKVRLTPRAAQDLTNIQGYISLELGNPAAAARVIKRITQNLRILERHAEAGPSVSAKTGKDTDLRMLVCEKHIALYRVDGDTVSIARVISAKQDYMRILFGNDL